MMGPNSALSHLREALYSTANQPWNCCFFVIPKDWWWNWRLDSAGLEQAPEEALRLLPLGRLEHLLGWT
jgi:hypothetical protein